MTLLLSIRRATDRPFQHCFISRREGLLRPTCENARHPSSPENRKILNDFTDWLSLCHGLTSVLVFQKDNYRSQIFEEKRSYRQNIEKEGVSGKARLLCYQKENYDCECNSSL